MNRYSSFIRPLSLGLALTMLCIVLLSSASCNKKQGPTVSLVIPTDSNSSSPSDPSVTDPNVTLTPTPIPEYRIGTVVANDKELVYVRQERNYTSRIVGAAVNGIDFMVTDEGMLWCKILFGEDEEGYLETKYLDIVTDTVAPEIHDAFFYMPATEAMGLVHAKFNGRLKLVPTSYTVLEMVPESDEPGAKLVEKEVTRQRLDIYTTSNVLLAKDTTLYLKNAVIKTTPLPSPSVTPSPSGAPTVTPTPSTTPTATPTVTATPDPTTPTPTTTEPSVTTAETTAEATASSVSYMPLPGAPFGTRASLAYPIPVSAYSTFGLNFEPTETTVPSPTPTPQSVEIIIRNGQITSLKGVTLDEDVEFKIGKDKGHVVTESGEVITYEGMFFLEAEVYVTEGRYDTPDAEIAIENGYYFEPALQKDALVDVTRYSDDIYIDMLLAKDENIAGGNVYGQEICLLQRDTLDKLLAAQEMFMKDGYSIIIYDAYRPYSVTCKMFDIHKDGTYVAGKRFGSIHNKGAAVDISIVDNSTGLPVEMPSPIHTLDSRSNRSNPNMTATARANMNYMAEIMRKCGFTTIASEWWHFTDIDSDDFLSTDHKLTEQIKIIYTS